MTELVNIKPEIHRIFVPLPENPLKNLNSYIIKTKERNLLIDTGFNRPECFEALMKGLEELNIDLNKTDIFLTHLHSDHAGLINKLQTENSVTYMGKTDYEYILKNLSGTTKPLMEKRFHEEGFPLETLIKLRDINQARKFSPDSIFPVKELEDRETFKVGDITFTPVLTPGHTPGHMCLYIEEEKILFSGDHILFHITPNITAWTGVKDSLKNYLSSLEKMKTFEIEKVFTAHRLDTGNPYIRIDELITHHHERLNSILDIIKKSGKEITAYEIASNMKWNLRGKSWEVFPENQKWFAVGEALSHLDYLYYQGKINKSFDEIKKLYKYTLAK